MWPVLVWGTSHNKLLGRLVIYVYIHSTYEPCPRTAGGGHNGQTLDQLCGGQRFYILWSLAVSILVTSFFLVPVNSTVEVSTQQYTINVLLKLIYFV